MAKYNVNRQFTKMATSKSRKHEQIPYKMPAIAISVSIFATPLLTKFQRKRTSRFSILDVQALD